MTLNDNEKLVYIVNTNNFSIEEMTRGEVKDLIGVKQDAEWCSSRVIEKIDNIGLIDFETLEDAKQWVKKTSKGKLL